jgi:FkbM family methyltransferase
LRHHIIRFIIRILRKFLLVDVAHKWGSYIAEEFDSLSLTLKDDHSYQYLTSNPLLLWRAETLFSKEPLTIDWLKSMKKEDILFDVGANVGMYTIYAGVRGVNVYSFEPESSNYYVLNRNILLNKIQKNVKAYNLALNNETSLDVLKLTSPQPGAAHTTFGANDAYKQNNSAIIFEQGAVSLTLDDLVYGHGLPVPNHIKIDVDGIESKIIQGSSKLLQDKKLRSILIEVNESSPEDQKLIQTLSMAGFEIDRKTDALILAEQKGVLRDCVFVRKNQGVYEKTH